MRKVLLASALLWSVPAAAQWNGVCSSGVNCTFVSPVITNPTITGGTINNTVIGGTTPAAATFTTLGATSGTFTGTGTNTLATLTNGTNTLTTSFAPTFSIGELQIINNVSGQNVFTILNPNLLGFGAWTVRNPSTGYEQMAMGAAGPSTGYLGAGPTHLVSFIEASTFAGGVNVATFSASISTTTMTVTGSPTGIPIAVGQVVSGSGVTAGTYISALGTGTGGAGTYTVSASQTVGSESMTGIFPPSEFHLSRTGFNLNAGNFQTIDAMRVENAITGVDGRWLWTAQNAASVAAFSIDPYNDFVTTNYRLLVGNANNSVTPVAGLDVWTTAIVGSQGSSFRGSDCVGTMNVCDASASLRIVASGFFKASIQTAESVNRWDFLDLDHSSVIPLSIHFDGTKQVVFGGAIQIGGAALTLTSGEMGFLKIAASGSAPGASGVKEAWVCGSGAGTAKKIAYAGTSGTPVTLIDNVGTGVTGC